MKIKYKNLMFILSYLILREQSSLWQLYACIFDLWFLLLSNILYLCGQF